MRSRMFLLAALLLFTASAFADTIQNSTGLASPDLVATFDGLHLPDGAPVTNIFNSQGVIFRPIAFFNSLGPLSGCCAGITGSYIGNFSGPSGLANPLVIHFVNSSPIAVAFAVATDSAPVTFTAFNGGLQVEQFTALTSSDGSTPIFFGFQNEKFDEIDLSVGGDGKILIDNVQIKNLQVTTPEPSALGLLATGVAGLFARRKRLI